jgi:2Fe-2S ferredoxin
MPAAKYKVTYIEDGGKAHTVEVAEGWSLMEGAVKHLIPGIDADCGGACACATCHVYVDKAWLDKLRPRATWKKPCWISRLMCGPTAGCPASCA